ncbi:MAG: hypothetical protein IJ131_08250 [Eggerthellaceae bacterium]|nr:hypothetical protein [Eggerthellaceae bacterium]
MTNSDCNERSYDYADEFGRVGDSDGDVPSGVSSSDGVVLGGALLDGVLPNDGDVPDGALTGDGVDAALTEADQSEAGAGSTAPKEAAPFDSFVFTSTDRTNGRVLFSMKREADAYNLHVEKGPAGQLVADFTRTVPPKMAEGLRDALAGAGVFGWDESYPDDAAPGTRRWNLKIVFKEGVFSQSSQGGSSVPEGFDDMLEALYQLDLPRPGADDAPAISMPAAGASAGFPDIAALFSGAPAGGPDASLFAEMQRAMADMQAHPERFQQQLKEEFRSLPIDQQEGMLDMLASTGMASREWWEKFLRG